MEKIVQLITILSKSLIGKTNSFSVQGNTYVKFEGRLNWEKYDQLMQVFAKFEPNKLTIIEFDMSINTSSSNVYFSFELLYEAEGKIPC